MSDCCSSDANKSKQVVAPKNETAGCCSTTGGVNVSAPIFTNAAESSCCAPAKTPTNSCCAPAASIQQPHSTHQSSCCDDEHSGGSKIDYLLWGSLLICSIFYLAHFLIPEWLPGFMQHFAHSIFEMLNSMWWGVLVGIFFVGLLANVPQNFVLSLLGRGGTINGLLRATAAGVLLDLCSHGILMVGMKLYQKGASLGQVMAFLIASPWNSFSLTIIMFSLIGLKWTLAFIFISMIIAIISGWIFDKCVANNILPNNANAHTLADDFRFWPEAVKQWQSINWSFAVIQHIGREGLLGSRMVLRWLLFGVVLAALIRTFVSLDFFQHWFGPTMIGMLFTLVAATVIEVCSEGSTPIAADLLNRALAPGNAFTFMMAGVSTDYTEIFVLKDTTKSWKIAMFLPLITLPQILVVGYVLNNV